MLDFFAVLLLAHLIADFPLQTNRVYALKMRCNFGIFFHVAIHLLVTALLLQNPLDKWPYLLALGLAHFTIDWLKVNYDSERQTPGFIVDQLAHFAVLLLLANLTAWPTLIPEWFLYPALLYAFIPALTLLLWVMATDLAQQEGRPPALPVVKWAQKRLLSLSHQSGFPLVVGMMASFFFVV